MTHQIIQNWAPFIAPIISEKTFAEAARSYVEHGGCDKYLQPIVDYFGNRPLASIYPFDVREMAAQLYPTQSSSTKNRQALTPARAVINHGYDRGWCAMIRIKRFKEDAPAKKQPASALWLHAFLRQCEKDKLPHVAAIVLFMAQTAARISEAVNLRWSEVYLEERRVLLLKTKTELNSNRFLTDELLFRLQAMTARAEPCDRVFRFTNRHSVNERIKAVCRRAGISYKSSHLCGRHTYATTAIDMGLDIRTAMDGGGWKSSSIFLNIYVHSRQNAGRLVADRFNSFQFDTAV